MLVAQQKPWLHLEPIRFDLLTSEPVDFLQKIHR